MRGLIVVAVSLLLSAVAAFADCTNPAAVAGTVFYNTSQNVAQFCANDSKWYDMGEANAAAAEGDCTNPAGKEGALFFNTSNNTLQFCNGEKWKNMGMFNWDNAPQTGCTNPEGVAGAMFYNTSANGNKGAIQFCNGSGWVNALSYTDKTWETSVWGACSATCGGGIQTRTATCVNFSGTAVADDQCRTVKPDLSQACNTQACTYGWNSGDWGACSVTCGGGTQSRAVTCNREDGTAVADGNCTGTKPETSQSCNTQACPYTYSWYQSGWNACSATCGGGTQTQTVYCRRSDGTQVADGNCTGTKPATSQACNTHVCPLSWVKVGSYSNCQEPGENACNSSNPGALPVGSCSSSGAACNVVKNVDANPTNNCAQHGTPFLVLYDLYRCQ